MTRLPAVRAILTPAGSGRHAGAVDVRDFGRSEGQRVARLLPSPDAMKPTKRILIVDDNPVVQEVLKQFLARGYLVELATNASQALASVVQKNPDAILLDVRMPGVDGLGLLKSLRGMGVETPIFVMTGYDSTQVALEALETGATGYLPKPFDLLHLDKLIAHALGSQPAYA
jgi:two-component system, response regulator, stage 0 sporulation protein F